MSLCNNCVKITTCILWVKRFCIDQCPYYEPNSRAEPSIINKYTSDNVNHPPHYKSETGLESIDVIEAFKLDFNLGNTIKYILRHKNKGKPLEDLKKARWYLERAIENLEKEKV